jgi:RNA polymerase sigma-70 factor (ECF subfamily)
MKKQFRKLAEEYQDRIYTYAWYSLQCREEAEDVTQEVLVKLWQHADEIDPGTLRAWVMRVTRNAVIDASRRRRSRKAVFADGVEVEAVADIAVSGVHGTDRTVVAREIRSALETALALLDEPYRSIVVLREIQGMTYAEVGETLDLPLNTVKVYLHRGRKMLREELRGKV